MYYVIFNSNIPSSFEGCKNKRATTAGFEPALPRETDVELKKFKSVAIHTVNNFDNNEEVIVVNTLNHSATLPIMFSFAHNNPSG